MTSVYFNYFFKGLVSKYIQRYWGMRLSTYEFGENTNQPLTVTASENSLVVFFKYLKAGLPSMRSKSL